MSLEQEYKNIDFPQFSNVKESLRQRLHEVRKQKSQPAPISILNNMKQELDWDQLDYMVAAGSNAQNFDNADEN